MKAPPVSTVTVPIATSKTFSCQLNLRWFVECTEYHPVPATFEPLVNGERAFGAVYDAILAAKNTVEIICWGFQPSMYFKRGDTSTLNIGQLLAMKAAEGVKVRILCWSDSLHVTALFAENMTPGRNLASFNAGGRNQAQCEFDWEWYRRATNTDARQHNEITALGKLLGLQGELAARAFSFGKEAFDNIEFVARDLGLMDRIEIAWQVAMRSADGGRSLLNKAGNTAAMAAVPTHHQKMVLVDYETPATAVGFVMGHNMLDAYWDRDDHSAAKMHAQFGRNGQTPRQDISSRVTGPVLEHLHHNFAEAWRDETGVDLLNPRKPLAAQLKPRAGFGPPMMAQVLRTQSQKGRRDIASLYLTAVMNNTQFIYIENQYFRWVPLAEQITKLAQDLHDAGRDTQQYGPLYLFVVTNSTDEGMGDGTVNTYRMLKQLGRPQLMPEVGRLQRYDELKVQLEEAETRYLRAEGDCGTFNDHFGNPPHEKDWVAKNYEIFATERDTAKQRYEDLKAQLPAEKDKPLTVEEPPGLKVVICTLVAPDSPAEKWQDVYIHSKLMIINDVFTTLGSANINTRSMEVDSELNICVEDPVVAKPLRKHLWGIHTDGQGAGDDMGKEFKTWIKISVANAGRRKNSKNPEPPKTSLTEFRRDSDKRSYLD